MKKQNVLMPSTQYAAGFIWIVSLLSSCAILSLLNSYPKELFNSGVTKEFTLKSNANGAFYHIQVGLPANYNPSEKYATIYVLDGKEIFGFVANRCKEISDKYGVKNVLVVSIGYGKDRSIDYTPTKMSSVTGGAPEFLNFIKTQLIPKMEEDFNADASREGRVILGHSYGGLFGAYAFSINNKVFGNYLLLSPSLWFDNKVTFKMESDNMAANKNRKQLVFMGIGGNEEVGLMLAPFDTFYQTLKNNYTNIQLEKNIEPNQNHMSSISPGIIKGVDFYFQNR